MSKVIVRKRQEIDKIREACRVAANVLDHMARHVRIGITTHELDQLARGRMELLGAESACYNSVIKLAERDDLYAHLHDNGIDSNVH